MFAAFLLLEMNLNASFSLPPQKKEGDYSARVGLLGLLLVNQDNVKDTASELKRTLYL